MQNHDTILEEQHIETRAIIQELLQDGSDPDALYTIEHHLSGSDITLLEKAAIDAFQLGYSSDDPGEFHDEEGNTYLSIDIFSELLLKPELIDAQVLQLVKIAQKYQLHYDGWGTYFEEKEENNDEDDLIDEDEE